MLASRVNLALLVYANLDFGYPPQGLDLLTSHPAR
jgi:hypothetical protein